MKVVNSKVELDVQFQIAQQEAYNFFGDSDVFIERYCTKPRHVEVQIVCDQHAIWRILANAIARFSVGIKN